MADPIAELLVTEAAIEKLGARGISIEEARQLPRNVHATVRNPQDSDGTRRLLIGRAHGGRTLTLVVERTIDASTWLIVTGWDATDAERRILGN